MARIPLSFAKWAPRGADFLHLRHEGRMPARPDRLREWRSCAEFCKNSRSPHQNSENRRLRMGGDSRLISSRLPFDWHEEIEAGHECRRSPPVEPVGAEPATP
jgi:hypothetical protein